jgi:hypothetical protein
LAYQYHFEDTWVGRPSRGGRRRASLFLFVLWNCFYVVLSFFTKTNNAAKAWHRGFESIVDGAHVNMIALKKELTLTETKYEQAVT